MPRGIAPPLTLESLDLHTLLDTLGATRAISGLRLTRQSRPRRCFFLDGRNRALWGPRVLAATALVRCIEFVRH